jgi:hypothetical protein
LCIINWRRRFWGSSYLWYLCSGSEKTNCREKKDKDDAELQLFLQEVENEKEMNDDEIAYDSDNSIEIEF